MAKARKGRKLRKENDRFIVVRDFYKIGSLLLEYNEDEHRRFVGDANTLRACESGNVEVVVMGGKGAPEVYSEYKPYTIVSTDKIDDVIKMVIDRDIPLPINVYMRDNPYVK